MKIYRVIPCKVCRSKGTPWPSCHKGLQEIVYYMAVYLNRWMCDHWSLISLTALAFPISRISMHWKWSITSNSAPLGPECLLQHWSSCEASTRLWAQIQNLKFVFLILLLTVEEGKLQSTQDPQNLLPPSSSQGGSGQSKARRFAASYTDLQMLLKMKEGDANQIFFLFVQLKIS